MLAQVGLPGSSTASSLIPELRRRFHPRLRQQVVRLVHILAQARRGVIKRVFYKSARPLRKNLFAIAIRDIG